MPIIEMPNGDRVQFPDDMPPERIRALIARKFPEAGRSTLQNLGMGALEGVSGDVIGAGQLAEAGVDYLRPGTSAAIKKQFPGVAAALHDVKEGSTRPTTSWAETIGRVGGGAAPFALAAPEIAGPTWLGRLAQAAFESGLAGGAQPTSSGTAGSHLKGAAEAAATTLGTLGAGGALHAGAPQIGKVARYGAGAAMASPILGLIHSIGLPYWLSEGITGIPPWALGWALRRTPPAKVVGAATEAAAKGAGKTVRAVGKPTIIGAKVGQYEGEDDEPGRDVYVHARPKDDSQQ